MSGIRLVVRDGEKEIESVQTGSVDDYYYFRDSIHAALEQGGFGSRFPLFLQRSEDDEWQAQEIEGLQKELETIAAAFRRMPPRPLDSNWLGRLQGSGRLCPSLFEVYLDARGRPLLQGILDLCAAARQANLPIAIDEASSGAEPFPVAPSPPPAASPLPALFYNELGIHLPPNYDGGCFRCSAGNAGTDGLCRACTEACTNSAEGLEEKARVELVAGSWYVMSLGANPPAPPCVKCGGTPPPPPDFVCVKPPGGGTGQTIFSFYLCLTCDAYVLRVNRFQHEEGGPHPATVGGAINRTMGDRDVEKIRRCPAPQNTKCECDAHHHFADLAEFMAFKDAERKAGRAKTHGEGVLSDAEAMADPEFLAGAAQALQIRGRRAAERAAVDTGTAKPWERPAEEVIPELIARELRAQGKAAPAVTGQTRLAEELGLDQIGIALLLSSLEEAYERRISFDATADSIRTVGDVIRAVKEPPPVGDRPASARVQRKSSVASDDVKQFVKEQKERNEPVRKSGCAGLLAVFAILMASGVIALLLG